MAGVVPAAVTLLREACLLEALRHPGVPCLYESSMLPDRRPWFAYERIAGPTLADRIAGGPLPPHEVAAIVRDLAETLEHVHRRGIVHRGLRPDRIVLSPDRVFGVPIVDWSDPPAHEPGERRGPRRSRLARRSRAGAAGHRGSRRPARRRGRAADAAHPQAALDASLHRHHDARPRRSIRRNRSRQGSLGTVVPGRRSTV